MAVSSEEADSMNLVSARQIGEEFLLAGESFHVLFRLAGGQRARREVIWNPYVKGQPALELDLAIKQMYCLRSC